MGRDPKGPFLWSFEHAVRIQTLFLRQHFGPRACTVHTKLFQHYSGHKRRHVRISSATTMPGHTTHRSSPEQRAKRQPPDQRSPSAENTSGQGRMESIGRGARAKRGMLKKQRNAGERKEVSAAIFGGKSHAYKNVMHDLDMKIRISKHRFICIG